MKTMTLHYIYDPLCGWCYGAAPLIRAARVMLPLQAHAGGMMAGARRQAVTPQLREFVLLHDRRIGQLSGQAFGEAYTDGLLRDSSAVFDSEPPTAAILAAEQLAGRGLDMLAQLQFAHYVEGRRIAERMVLIEVAVVLGLAPDAVATALDRQAGNPVQQHIQATRELMARVGAQGFPTLVLETGDGMQIVDISRYMGRPQEFQDWLRAQIPAREHSSETVVFGCDANGCAL